jgi:hypothetical protein
MKRLMRLLHRHFGPTALHVAVHAEIPIYWRLFWVVLLMLLGFCVGYWRYAGGSAATLRSDVALLEQENKELRTQAIHVTRQQQVNNVAQRDLTKDLASLQGENVKLKEDVAFYKSILEESSGVAVVKLHDFKIMNGEKPGEYRYRMLLIQSGRHDKNVQGSVQLAVVGMQNGKPTTQVVVGGINSQRGGKVNFKYYQPLEGGFTVPTQLVAEHFQAKFFQAGSSEPKLIQEISLSN